MFNMQWTFSTTIPVPKYATILEENSTFNREITMDIIWLNVTTTTHSSGGKKLQKWNIHKRKNHPRTIEWFYRLLGISIYRIPRHNRIRQWAFFTPEEFRENAKNRGVHLRVIVIGAHNSIEVDERYQYQLRRILEVIRSLYDKFEDRIILKCL